MRHAYGFARLCNKTAISDPLEALHPGPQFHLVGPGALRLPDHAEVRRSDGVGVKEARGLARRVSPALAPDAAVDDDMGHMDALGMQLPRHALGEPAQRELAHRERRRLGIAL